MSIIWSDLAIEELNDIEDYIARDNPARAVSFVDELIDLGAVSYTHLTLPTNSRV